jgi:hypothetical protein
MEKGQMSLLIRGNWYIHVLEEPEMGSLSMMLSLEEKSWDRDLYA